MTQLASLADVARFLGRELSDAEEDQAELLLQLTSAAIQAECRQHLELVTDDQVTMYPDFTRHSIRLPERPVWNVSSFKVGGVTVVGLTWTTYGHVFWQGDFADLLLSGTVLNAPDLDPDRGLLPIHVKYTHGYALAEADLPDPNPLGILTLPDDLRLLCLQKVAGALQDPGAIQAETIGSYTATYGPAGAGVALTEEDKILVRRYRQTVLA